MENGNAQNRVVVGGEDGQYDEHTTNGDDWKENRIPSQKRQDYMSWDEYFMGIAFLSAQRSKDPRTQVGACIVNEEKRIVGIGYNGMPKGCSDDIFPWGRTSKEPLQRKYLYVCHAEMNAILNSADVRNCVMYVALFPCNECAKMIIQSGIKEVVYYSDKYGHKDEFKASRMMMIYTGIKLRQYQSEKKQVVLDFDSINDSLKSGPDDQTAEKQDPSDEFMDKIMKIHLS